MVEVAHDIQNQVSGYIMKILNLVNSFDTWHAGERKYVCTVHITGRY